MSARFRLRPTSSILGWDDAGQVETTKSAGSWDVSAIQWDGTNETEISEMVGGREMFRVADRPGSEHPGATAGIRNAHLDWLPVYTGDWVVRRDDGRVFRLSDEDFWAAYEQVAVDTWINTIGWSTSAATRAAYEDVSPYDQGGLLPSAVEVRTNRTGQAIPVVTRDQL